MDQLKTAIHDQEALYNYFMHNDWRHDYEKQQLEAIVEKINSSSSQKVELDQFIAPESQVQCIAFIYQKQQEIRKINRKLQDYLQQTVQIQTPSQCVIAQLPPRNKNTIQQQIQLINMFKQNFNELKQCFSKLCTVIDVDEKRDEIQKQIGLLQIAENFKFELSCLEKELLQNRNQLSNEFENIKQEIDSVIDNNLLQALISYCTAISKVKILLKKQQLLVISLKTFDFIVLYKELYELDKENRYTSYSEETNCTSLQSPQKSQEQKAEISQNLRQQACLCTIF